MDNLVRVHAVAYPSEDYSTLVEDAYHTACVVAVVVAAAYQDAAVAVAEVLAPIVDWVVVAVAALVVAVEEEGQAGLRPLDLNSLRHPLLLSWHRPRHQLPGKPYRWFAPTMSVEHSVA